MRILIDCVRIYGFRGLSNIEVSLRPLTLLIGANNTGKTSVIKAIQLALGDYSRFLTEEDFFIDENDKKRERIIIDIRIIPADSNNSRITEFSDIWRQEFTGKIQSEPSGGQYLAIRTIAFPDKLKGGFEVERYHLTKWPEYSNWIEEKVNTRNKFPRFDSIKFISVESQRDIHSDLKDKFSFVGKILSGINYKESDIKQLEEMISVINQEAIEKSHELKILKEHLDKLNSHFDGTGNTELSPFPKKIRDLSKRFSIHFGETEKNTFSMEYHGMGTRSWASMLTVKAFSELLSESYKEEEKPLFCIIAAEEPEAHLHPNAQRTLYSQLSDTEGQVIISSHSPHLAAMADIDDLRGMNKDKNGNVQVRRIAKLDEGEILSIKQHVLLTRGEILFSKAVILFEGLTEEQLISTMFETYFGFSGFSVGVSFTGVSGRNYPPFIKISLSFGIPVCIVSDCEPDTYDKLSKQQKKLEEMKELSIDDRNFFVRYMSNGNNIERELLNVLNLRDEINDAFIKMGTHDNPHPKRIVAKRNEIEGLSNEEILNKMINEKAHYSAFLSEIIAHNPYKRKIEELIPEAAIGVFEKVKEWLKL